VSRDAGSVYREREADRRHRAELLGRRARALAHARLLAFAVGAAALWLAIDRRIPWVWPPLALLGFAALVVLHDRARGLLRRASRAAAFYADGLARLELRFAGRGRPGEHHRDSEHPYADHLDLFGTGSLYELLSRAKTRAGERLLARWLREPAEPAEIRARQQSVRELTPRLDLREELAILGPELSDASDPDALDRFGAAPPRLGARDPRRWLAALLAPFALATLSLALFTELGFAPFLGVALLEAAVALPLRPHVRAVQHELGSALEKLTLLSELLRRLEREHPAAPRLRELRERLHAQGRPPSLEIRSLRRRVELLDARRNQLFAPLTPLLLWSTQLAFSIEAWRARAGPRLAGWLETVGELEALLDLAAHAYEHPKDVFPEIVERGPLYEARALGHPLLTEQLCVRNDLSLGPDCALQVVSGSNMSGKSTWLRAVGTNAVLALAGAPVRAAELRISPLALGATLRIEDSLQDGRSRFFAEILGLRRIVERTRGPLPVLFLLDEVLAGTNSHDRRIGAAAVVRGLLATGAIGLVTTHDLALCEIVDALAPRARNVHFADDLREGEIEFDYRLRDGVVQRSNALALMRAVGLDV
jgi:hypothetical protein